MTMFFSHPAVEGVLLWGFWDGAVYDKKFALATGSNVTVASIFKVSFSQYSLIFLVLKDIIKAKLQHTYDHKHNCMSST
jgi:hypothetical protein